MRKRDLAASSLGNTLEWFDFGLFIFLAPIIGAQFFPSQDAATSTLAAFGVFAAGFICRPLGGVLFGHWGDMYGRSKTLRISILVITFSTFIVSLLPTYKVAGMIAPILFTLLRLIQGISVGGEYSGVMIYLAESAPDKKRGFITSFAAIGANLGFLLATVMILILKSVLTVDAINAWGWRVPFFVIGLFGSVISFYRLRLHETPAFLYLKKSHHIEKKPFLSALRFAPTKLLKILGLTCMSSTFYYGFFAYIPEYLAQYAGVSSPIGLIIESASFTAMLFLVPLAGMCGDFWGRRTMLLITALGIILLTIPCFYLFQDKTLISIILSLSIATVLSSMDQGNSLTAVVENCPVDVRYTGVAFSYNLGNALFGGTAPLIVSLLTQHYSLLAPAYYLMLMAGISFVVILTLAGKKDTQFLKVSHGESWHPYEA